jgi:poly-gamma-glutamate synthesis protein (capsule biosynthesis protein)
VTDGTARSAKPAAHRKKTPLGAVIVIVLAALIVAIGSLLFFNWDKIVNLREDTLEQINGTPTPIPTKMITPTPTLEPTGTNALTDAPTPVDSPTPLPEIVDVTISAVGDIMVHQAQLDDAYDPDTGTYDFTRNFDEIAPSLSRSDLLIGSILTTFSGEEYGYSGTPLFNTPDSMLTALAGAGFDVLTTGNSHIFDFGWIGLERTNEKIKSAGIYTTGTYLNEKEYYDPLIIDVNGLKVAILSFTDEAFEEDKISDTKLDYCIKYIKKSRIKDNIELARQNGADIVIVCLHWGEEYERTPSGDMRDLAQYVLEQDADVILGTKSHVIQQAKVLSIKAENGNTKERVVAYSLGNFISNQRAPYKDAGMILNLHFRKNNTTGEAVFTGADYIPTWVAIDETDDASKNFRVLPVGKYLTDSTLLNTLPQNSKQRLEEVWNETTTVIGTQLIPALNE